MKLLLAACFAAISVAANAASAKWEFAGKVVPGSAGEERASYYTMLIFNQTDAAAVTAALSGETVDYDALNSLKLDSVQAAKAGSFSGQVNDITGSSVTLFGVAFDTAATGDSITTASNYYRTGTITVGTYDPTGTDEPTTATFTSAQMTGTWTPVPEPTAVALLLLGAAGLALRRKRV
ncbi:MAG: PEP-CTERM sorting domain-containing protein [Kiritimatiellae bacterium]|nr:PEP-CTERM sorting domain-containing protein [Kiritimatiellia bacterium]MBP5511710.1 PEP-CTERM sorting domain-containing protein [Kiritimatiellia bacterium]